MKDKVNQSIAVLTVCLPAIIYVTWLDAYYWLLESGRYKAFIQPKLWPLLILALMLLLAFTAAFISRFSLKPKIPIQFDTWLKGTILIIPVFFLWTIYGQSLGADAFAKRELIQGQIAARGGFYLPESSSETPADHAISLLDLLADAERFHGKRLATEGMVYRGAKNGKNTFTLFRFAVVCCAADAIPLAVTVRSSAAEKIGNNAWVRVVGLFNLETINGRQVTSIAADVIQPIPPPPPDKRYLFF
jgi:putative membrane protein